MNMGGTHYIFTKWIEGRPSPNTTYFHIYETIPMHVCCLNLCIGNWHNHGTVVVLPVISLLIDLNCQPNTDYLTILTV